MTRRNFLQHAMTMASGLAICSMLPPFATKAWAQDLVLAGQPLQTIMEIKSSATKTLQAVLKILDEQRTTMVPGRGWCR